MASHKQPGSHMASNTTSLPRSVSNLVEHPTVAGVEAFALEVFSNPAKSEKWMTRQRASLGGRSPRECISHGDVDAMREVLDKLIAINFGIYT